MPPVAPRAEAISEHGRRQRPGERQRDRGWRSGERAERRGAGDAVRLQPGPRLEAPQRRVDVRTEDPVEGTRGKAVLCELELERRHVPTSVPDQKLAAAEPMLGEAAEGSS